MRARVWCVLLVWLLCPVPAAAAPDQEQAQQRAHEPVAFVAEYQEEGPVARRMRLYDQGLTIHDIEHTYVLLDSPVIRAREDSYGPVRFSHGKHAALINDCSVCHHYRPADHTMAETVRCVACHQEPFDPAHPERIGLKAAYHLRCMTCHEQQHQGPVGCRDCHLPTVPDHAELVELADAPEPSTVTGECLRCHDAAGHDMLTSAHWLWRGPALYTAQHIQEIKPGKGTIGLNNY